MDNIQLDASKLWHQYKKKNKELDEDILAEYKNNKVIDIYSLMKKIEAFYLPI